MLITKDGKMHEHGLARDIYPELEKLAQENNLSKVTHVILDIGMLHGVEADFLAHSFEHAFEGTIFEGAKVEINIIEPSQEILDENNKPAIATGREIIIRKIDGESDDVPQADNQATPVCLKCLEPIDPLTHYCSNCGEATGNLTPYIPFVNIPYNYSIFGRMWNKFWYDKEVSIASKGLYFFLIIFLAPIMIVGLPFVLWNKYKKSDSGSSGQVPVSMGHCVPDDDKKK